MLGSMGEDLCLSDDVGHAFIETALVEAGDRITIFASAADLSLQRMREIAIRYAGLGVPCVVLCLPPGVAPAKAVADVKAVADCCPVPCCYYACATTYDADFN